MNYLQGSQGAGGAGNDPGMAIYSADGCTLLGCNDDFNNVNSVPGWGNNTAGMNLSTLGLISGNTYLVRIYNEGNTANSKPPTYTYFGGAANGCDSTVTLDLTINSFVTGTDVQVACIDYLWIDGITYSATTNTPTYTYVGGAANGCDSVVTLDLTINNPTTGTVIQVACVDYTWIDGITYTVSTNTPTYTYIGGAANGCDSVVTLDLTINNPATGTDVQQACIDYTWIDGITYSSSTNTPTYTYIGGAANGCDSTVTLNLSIQNYPSAPNAGADTIYCASMDYTTMTASGGSGTFTWYADAGLTNVIGNGNSMLPEDIIGMTEYFVTETVNGCEGPASLVTITINECGIVIPTAITPDGDGINDRWEIVDLDLVYAKNVVRIYNRWGALLYEHDSAVQGPYNNDRWDGTYNGDSLPVGSYFFIIEFNDKDSGSSTGAVSILK